MRKFSILVALATFFVAVPRLPDARTIDVLMIVPQDYGANFHLYLDDLSARGWNVTTAGTSRSLRPCPTFGDPVAGCREMEVDLLIDEITDISGYDCVAVMSSSAWVDNPYGDLLASGKLPALLKEADRRGKIIWGQCGAVRVLAAAGVIKGRRVVGHPKFKDEYTAAGAEFLGNNHPPVIDGNIVTGVRGQYYHFQNSNAVITAVERMFPKGDPESADNNSGRIDESVLNISGAVWARAFGGRGSEGAGAVAPAGDGGFIIAGYTDSWGNGFSDLLLIRTGPDGKRKWAKTFGGAGWEYGNAVCAASDGGYIVAGSSSSWGKGSRDVFVLRTDSDGKALWSRTLGGPGADVAAAVCETGNGGILVCGYTDSYGRGEEDVYLAGMDGGGKVLWTRTFGYERYEMGSSVFETDGGDIVVTGSSGSPELSGDNADFYLVRTDALGNPKWERAYGNSVSKHPFDFGRHGIRTRDGGCLVVGDSDVNAPLDLYVLKTDSAGEKEWLKNYGGRFYEYACAAYESGDNEFLVCGTKINSDSGDRDIYMDIIAPDGSGLSMMDFRMDGGDRAGGICPSGDGGCVIVGQTESGRAGGYDLLIMKVAGRMAR